MNTYITQFDSWIRTRHRRCLPVRRMARIVALIKRTTFEPVRLALFKPGPYRDGHGNMRFLSRKNKRIAA